MYEHGGPARLAAIVDWEMGTVGDPKIDLAWVVQSWPDETVADEEPSGYVDMTHMPTRSQMLDRYAAVSGRQVDDIDYRSEEHTSELQSQMRISYAVFCLKKKIQKSTRHN